MSIEYCGRCGKKFDTFYGQSFFCSRRCRILYYRQLHAGKRLEGIVDKIYNLRDEKGDKVNHLSKTDLFGYKYKVLVNMYKDYLKYYPSEVKNELLERT